MAKKSRFSVIVLTTMLMILCLLLTGCKCEHEWVEANCTVPKTCTLCQEIEGEALGHTWVDANCETPKTCSVCSATDGEALGHTWVDANCETPKTCSVCNATDGEALGHTWVDATCTTLKTCSVCQKTEGELAEHKWQDATTEAPKTCSVCQKTEGERIITDSRFKTAANKELFGTWSGIIKTPCEDIVGKDFTHKAELNFTITFKPDGTFSQTSSMVDKDGFISKVENFYIEQLYKEFTALGYDHTKADEAMVNTYGMDVKAYSKYLANAINWDSLFAPILNGVYYINNEKLYSGTSWNNVTDTDNYSIADNVLSIESLSKDFPELALTKSS